MIDQGATKTVKVSAPVNSWEFDDTSVASGSFVGQNGSVIAEDKFGSTKLTVESVTGKRAESMIRVNGFVNPDFSETETFVNWNGETCYYPAGWGLNFQEQFDANTTDVVDGFFSYTSIADDGSYNMIQNVSLLKNHKYAIDFSNLYFNDFGHNWATIDGKTIHWPYNGNANFAITVGNEVIYSYKYNNADLTVNSYNLQQLHLIPDSMLTNPNPWEYSQYIMATDSTWSGIFLTESLKTIVVESSTNNKCITKMDNPDNNIQFYEGALDRPKYLKHIEFISPVTTDSLKIHTWSGAMSHPQIYKLD